MRTWSSGLCTTWRLGWVTFTCAWGRVHTRVPQSYLDTLHRYDDHSDPPLRDLLEPWIQSNIVTYLKMVHDHEEKRSKDWQLLAYNHCMDTFSIRHEWLGVIDSDEFIYLTSPQHPSLQDLLVKEFDQYSGLVMTWRLYGSSGHVHRPNGVLTAY